MFTEVAGRSAATYPRTEESGSRAKGMRSKDAKTFARVLSYVRIKKTSTLEGARPVHEGSINFIYDSRNCCYNCNSSSEQCKYSNNL